MITREDVKERLSQLGYTASEADDGTIDYIILKVQSDLLAYCGILEIPEQLYYKWVDMVCGELLSSKKNSGQDIGIDVDSAVSSIAEGDTTIKFINGNGQLTNEQRVNQLVYFLLDKTDLVAYRRIPW